MGLVSKWLNGIGLQHAVPSFTAAGIVTPTALAEIDPSLFEALSVTDPDDRRKLFYLVQRVKKEVEKKDEMAEKVDAVLNSSFQEPPHPASLTTTHASSAYATNSTSTTRPFSFTIPKSSHNLEEASDESTDVDDGNSDWDYADDEASRTTFTSRNSNITGRRKSQRLQSKKKQIGIATVTSMSYQRNKNKIEMNNKGIIPSPKPRASLGSSNSFTNSHAKNGHGRNGARLPASSSRRRSSHAGAQAQDSDSSDLSPMRSRQNTNTSPKRSTRKTGMQAPKGRRLSDARANNPSKSRRTGKQLASIPADSIAPMSPLFDLATSKKNRNKQNKYASSDYPSSISGNENEDSSENNCRQYPRPSSESDLINEKLHNRRSNNKSHGFGGNISDSDRSLSSKRQQNLVTFSNGENNSHSESSAAVDRWILPSTHNKRLQSASSTATKISVARVTVHKARGEQDSWKEQILLLREDAEEEHELFNYNLRISDTEFEDMGIRVAVRKRPMSKSEVTLLGDTDVIQPLDYGNYGRIMVYQPKKRVDLTKEIETVPFAFDNVFSEESTNAEIYDQTVEHLIPGVFKGQWATVFAYGQTGSGKTFTMMGATPTQKKDRMGERNLGLYYLAALDVFDQLEQEENRDIILGVSLFEIYGGKLFDLLNEREPVKCLEDGDGQVRFPGLSEHQIMDPESLIHLIEKGGKQRSTGHTSRNADSSRSHAILQLHLRKPTMRKNQMIEQGRLSFIDLAGSERGADTANSSKTTRLEGAEINSSLLALKEVIRALATGDSMRHVPFRGSKLTQVLKQGFVGENCRSVMIACISPNIGNCEQTLNTLRYADRVKERNKDTGALAATARIVTRGRRRSSLASHSIAAVSSSECVDEEENFCFVENDSYCSAVENVPSQDFDSRRDSILLDNLLGSSEEDETRRPGGAAAEGTLLSGIEAVEYTSKSGGAIMEDRFRLSASSSISLSDDKKAFAMALSEKHSSVLKGLMGMMQGEMEMVNRADLNRDDMQQYLAELHTAQEKQLSLISDLKNSLNTYNEFVGIPVHQQDPSANENNLLNDDDSFEDLRDI